jgi:perosamine synthetase
MIPYSKPSICGKESEFVTDAIKSTWLSGGEYIDRLEKWFSSRLDSKHTILVSNGTTALQLAFMGLGIGVGDEVIVPGFGFMAAGNLLLHIGAKPVFADVDPHTWCMSALDIEKKFTDKTKAVVVIHSYGNVCDMDDIMTLIKDVPVIEDGAEALFSTYNGRQCGTIGTIGTFSMHATKTITTGEGGFVLCDDDKLAELMVTIRSHGLPVRGSYNHVLAGHNFRLTNLQAAFGCAQVENADWVISERQRVYETYKKLLNGQDGITMQLVTNGVDPIMWVIGVRLSTESYPQGRDTVVKQMKSLGVETRPGFVPSSRLGYFPAHSVPISESLGESVMSLPSYPLLTDAEISTVCEQLISVRS